MNLFEFFSELTHMRSESKWAVTTAHFTGKVQKATLRNKLGPREGDYNAYEITYYADERKIYGWHTFYPLPDPDSEFLKGSSIYIRYNRKKPYIFELVSKDSLDY
ncbi:MAG: hypothetical protein J5504_10395 [Butyrivibrio sp.]|nr:hypothetical protein [Butyrivibrio sp.]